VIRSWQPERAAGTVWEAITQGGAAISPDAQAAAFSGWKDRVRAARRAGNGGKAGGEAVEAMPPPSYTAEFTAPRSGELFLYLNDALVWDPFRGLDTSAYTDNAGTGRVVVTHLPADR
jgi:hypothetical protein